MDKKYKILVKGIVKCNDKYLIVEKWVDDNIVEPYQWGFCDGELEYGDSPDRAVLQLITEQTNVHAFIGKILYTWTFIVGEVCNLGIAYLCYTESDEVFLNEDLHDFRWVTRDEFADYINNERVLADIEKAELE